MVCYRHVFQGCARRAASRSVQSARTGVDLDADLWVTAAAQRVVEGADVASDRGPELNRDRGASRYYYKTGSGGAIRTTTDETR